MKKMLAFGLVAAAGVTTAFASSLGVPWFVDSAAANTGIPPTTGTCGLIYLHNNTGVDKVCDVTYYTSTGVQLVPTPVNTFIVPANSSVAFRPVASDPGPLVPAPLGKPLGQESPVGLLVPDRPTTVNVPPGNDGKKNGSCAIGWSGLPTDIQGMYNSIQTVPGTPAVPGAIGNTVPLVVSVSITLPPGA